ncbi:hypothetical protein [Nonomuraea typhae]|uniref:hypothetical protein n=1 Tax=Nonomuraea typhae TaxID=2603600 RepID=UPI0012F76331|nr:hypothetical protein [Nonomuraea typhae]
MKPSRRPWRWTPDRDDLMAAGDGRLHGRVRALVVAGRTPAVDPAANDKADMKLLHPQGGHFSRFIFDV